MAKENKISMEHGAGGQQMQSLIGNIILKNFTNTKAGSVGLEALDDGATIAFDRAFIAENKNAELVMTTDSHVVKPIFFPGGDIGKVAVCGAINDLAVMGARPLAVSSGMIIPEGFSIADLEKVVHSMNDALTEVGVPLITGDTKTVEGTALDSIMINIAAIGICDAPVRDCGLRLGDKIIISGFIADHGMALLTKREGFEFSSDLESDTAPLWKMIEPILSIQAAPGERAVTAMKDPTRGGVADALNEMAQKSKVGIRIYEEKLPIREAVVTSCEMLGLDPLEIANEGKAVIGVRPECAEAVLALLKQNTYGKDAAIIGEVVEEKPGKVILVSELGSTRYVDVPTGDPIPRVC
ncbi:Carbamoyl dehydratase HypE [Methanimicrococcus sp. At1]|uniref:Carbamoyl dehydratase HypE n=1 Tax=Methanimicrococcus hacksteinii TaxID=3028293 RepID=A0ABU3VMQ1_9EURY|nr:hydrogenase expression/formation protein HypE [Methanimicrococcus sp. At1]MDV0444693.1 Carbamoyl dehydratase HypE [Methanimicrococcus sp. At1]